MKKFIATSIALAVSLANLASIAAEQAVITDNRVNVRGQAKLYSEVITQLKKGDQVTVLERIAVQNPKPGEPTNWAKIKLPPNTTVWVYAPMVKDGAVSGSRLNLRAGPGENYSVLGRVNKGATITEIRTVEDWMEIEPPAEAYAFMDSRLLKTTEGSAVASTQPGSTAGDETAAPTDVAEAASPGDAVATPSTAAASTPAPQPEEPKLESATVGGNPEAVAKTQDLSVPGKGTPTPGNSAKTGAAAVAGTTTTTFLPLPRQAPAQPVHTTPDLALHLPKTAPEPEQREPLKEKRIVRREGIVKGTFSIQAPTYFELENELTGKAVNYLHAEKSGLDLRKYKKLKVIVTGEEYIDPRWPKTPVIEIETLEPAQ